LGELVDGLVHVLETPSARLAESALRVVALVAEQQALEALMDVEMSDAARRRLGFLSETLAEVTPGETFCRLVEFAKSLHRAGDPQAEPVTFTAVVRPSLVRALKRRADEVNRRWAVYGGPDPAEYTSSV
jgi:hypothetical protein